jgi:hypothetical protein
MSLFATKQGTTTLVAMARRGDFVNCLDGSGENFCIAPQDERSRDWRVGWSARGPEITFNLTC